MAPIPITIVTGFLGSGKTTILLNLIPQLPADYRLALLKNEFGDVAVDSALAAANSISGVRELLNGCICCNLVGQLSDALVQLRDEVNPDRIVIETSGSAFPATLAMEVNRLSRSHRGEFVLDGVISVIDVENWQGYEDTSYTAKLQARYTDLIIFNKWEDVPEQRFDICLDRVGDLDIETAWVKSTKGRVDKDVLLGIDGSLLSKEIAAQAHGSLDLALLNGADSADEKLYKEQHSHDHSHTDDHQSEVEVLSATVTCADPTAIINITHFVNFLLSARKDEIYRIKGIIRCSVDDPPEDSSGERAPARTPKISSVDGTAEKGPRTQNYILNWAFGRWTFTPCPPLVDAESADPNAEESNVARVTVILARNESTKWQKKLENNGILGITGPGPEQYVGTLRVERMN